MDSIKDLLRSRESPMMRQLSTNGSEPESKRTVRVPDDCICSTLPGGDKMGWIYPTHYTDGSVITPVTPTSGGANPDYGKAIPCACSRAKSEQRYRAFLWEQANIPKSPRDGWRFTDYKCAMDEQHAALSAVIEWSAGQSDNRWLLLRGPVGTGKTHLAAAAIAALVGGKIQARYEYVPDLIDYLRAGQIDGRYEERIAQLRAVEALALDDMAATTSSDTEWARGEILKVVDWRYRERAPLLVTCNTLDIWSATTGFDARLADRLTERGLSRDVMMIWNSYRQGGQ